MTDKDNRKEKIPDLLSLMGVAKTKRKVSSKKAREEFEMYLATRSLRRNKLFK